jgi:hypothetical protein
MLKNILAAALVALALAGCALPHDPGREYTVSGQDLGSSARRPITIGESKVSFTGPSDPVRSREVKALVDRYSEFLVLNNGANLNYSRLYLTGFSERDSDESVLRADVEEQPGYRDRGIVFDRKAVKRFGPFSYIVQTSSSNTCFAFHGTFGAASSPRNNRGDQESFGGICYSAALRTAPQLEREMLDLLGRARFDDGAINKARAAGVVPAPPASATVKAAPPPVAVTSPSAPPSPASATMAGRLRELRGLLDQGLISQSEYDERRQTILNSL